jgi:hypothetical protein
MIVFSVRIAFSAEASFFPYLSLTCSRSSSTCSLNKFDLKDSEVYTPAWRFAVGRFGGFDVSVAFTTGAGLRSSSASSPSD